MMVAIGTEYADAANVLCENSSAQNYTEIVLEGDNIGVFGLTGLQLSYSSVTGQMSVLVDYVNHRLTIADIDKKSGARKNAIALSPNGNEPSFKISGKNIKITKPCNKNVDFGGITCMINYTARSTSMVSGW